MNAIPVVFAVLASIIVQLANSAPSSSFDSTIKLTNNVSDCEQCQLNKYKLDKFVLAMGSEIAFYVIEFVCPALPTTDQIYVCQEFVTWGGMREPLRKVHNDLAWWKEDVCITLGHCSAADKNATKFEGNSAKAATNEMDGFLQANSVKSSKIQDASNSLALVCDECQKQIAEMDKFIHDIEADIPNYLSKYVCPTFESPAYAQWCLDFITYEEGLRAELAKVHKNLQDTNNFCTKIGYCPASQ